MDINNITDQKDLMIKRLNEKIRLLNIQLESEIIKKEAALKIASAAENVLDSFKIYKARVADEDEYAIGFLKDDHTIFQICENESTLFCGTGDFTIVPETLESVSLQDYLFELERLHSNLERRLCENKQDLDKSTDALLIEQLENQNDKLIKERDDFASKVVELEKKNKQLTENLTYAYEDFNNAQKELDNFAFAGERIKNLEDALNESREEADGFYKELKKYKKAFKYAVIDAQFKRDGVQTTNNYTIERIEKLGEEYLERAKEDE